MIVDRELKVRSVNQLFCKIFNLTAAATEGKDLAAIANKNWNGTELTKLLQDTVLVKKAFRDFELSGDFAGIGKRTYLLSAREFRWIDVPETEPESILITIFDITERKNIELALEESELTYRTILESAHDSIVAVDDKGIIKIANSQTEKWFGYPRGELLGKNFEILIPNAFRQSHAKLHKDYLAQPTARAMAERSSLSGQRKDGTTFPIEVSLSPVKMSQGLLVIAVLRDVTFRRQIEDERGSLLKSEKSAREEAEKANRAKDLFLATLSHELRTPLSSILTWAQLIRHGKVDLAQAQVGAEVIEKSAKTQSQLIDDLLDISRIIAGKLAIEITEVELHDVILFAVESVRALWRKNPSGSKLS
jgi:PAS domain S-box-containing protein